MRCRASTSSPCVRSLPTSSGSPPGLLGARSRFAAPAPLEDRREASPCAQTKEIHLSKDSCTNVMCQQWGRWAALWLRARTLTGFLPALAPLPQPLLHLPDPKTQRADCWSGRTGRKGCLRCLCRYWPLLQLGWRG